MDEKQPTSPAEQDRNLLLELSADGRVTCANRAALALFPDIGGSGPEHPFLTGVVELARNAKEQGGCSSARSIRVSGRWYEQCVILIPGSDGFRVHAHDDTARRGAEERLRVQRDLAIGLLGSVSLDEALSLVLRVALDSTGMDCGAVYRLGRRSEGLRLVDSLGVPDATVAGMRLLAEGRSGPVRPWAARAFYATPDALGDVPESQRALRDDGVLCFGIVPIHHRGQLLASIHLGSRAHREFPFEAREHLETLAALVGHVVARFVAQRSLRESENRYRTLFETMELGVILQDADGAVVAANPAAQRILGRSEAELRENAYPSRRSDCIDEDGGPFPDGDHPSMVALRTRQPVRGVVMGVYNPLAEGHVWLVVGATPQFRESEAEACGAFVTFADITERKRAEQALQQSEEQLARVRKLESIGQLAGGVAHDLNNMLSPILGYAEMMLADLPAGHRYRPWAEQITGAAERARDLVRQLLAFARRQTLEMEPLDLNALIRGFQPMLRRTIREDVTIDLRLASSVGAVDGDVGQVEQALLNLAINAQDAMPDGGLLLIETADADIDGSYRERHPEAVPGPYAMVSVSDTGVGMDAQTLERAFEPFFTTKELGRGTGLGLATVYGVVKQHQGFIWAYSEPGKGATFRIYLPRTSSALRDIPEVPQLPSTRGTETILVVEDQEHVRTLVCEMLTVRGYHVLSAPDGESALPLAAAHEGGIDLLVTDVILTGMNGREMYGLLAEVRPETRVLFMSGHAANVISHHGILNEGVDFIQKPFSLSAFAAKVREVLDRPRRTNDEP